MQYEAFISYSHAVDDQLAPAVQSGLHRLARPWYRLRALSVFRDKTNLSVSPGLWPSIQEALRNSEYFVFLASPEAALSKWVDREISYWLERKGAERILIVLTAGELVWNAGVGRFDRQSTTSMPPSLLGAIAREPLYLDLRWARGAEDLSLSNPRFRDSMADLAATLRGISKSDLIDDDVRQNRRTRRLVRSTLVGLAILFGVAATLARVAQQQRDLAIERNQIAIARQLAAQAELELNRMPVLLPTSVTLAAESLRRRPTAEGKETLRKGLALLAKPVTGPLTHAEEVVSARFSADESLLMTVTKDGTLHTFRADTGSKLGQIRQSSHASHVGIRDDLGLVAVVDFEGVSVWSVREQREIRRVDHGSAVYALALSPAGRSTLHPYLATGGFDHFARLWDLETGRQVAALPHGDGVVDLEFASDGRRLATASWDGTARVWSVPDGIEEARYEHAGVGSMIRIALAPDGQSVASASNQGNVRVWSMANGQVESSFEHGQQVEDLEFSRDGQTLASAGFDGTARLWDLETQREVLRVAHVGPSKLVSFSATGRYLVTGAGTGAHVWHGSAGSTARIPRGGSTSLSSDGAFLTNSNWEVVEVWQTEGPQRVATFPAARANVVAVNTEGTVLVSGHRDGARIWRSDQAEPGRRLPGSLSVSEVAITPDGTVVAIGGERRVELWRLTDGQRLLARDYDSDVSALDLSQDGRFVAVGTGDFAGWEGSVELLRAADGERLHVFDFESRVEVARFSSDRRYLAIGCRNSEITVWELDRLGDRPRRFAAEQTVTALSFDPETTQLAAADQAGIVQSWQLEDSTQIARMSSDFVIESLSLDERDGVIATGSPGRISRWHLTVQGMLRDVCQRISGDLPDNEWRRYLEEPPEDPLCGSPGEP